MEKIRKDKEKFREEKKSQKEAEKRAKIEKLVNNSKVDETGAKGITGGEPSDEIAKTRRNFIKKVRSLVNAISTWTSLVLCICSYAFSVFIIISRYCLY